MSKVSKIVEISNSIQVRQQYLRCNYTKFQLKIPVLRGYVLKFPREAIFSNFTLGMMGNETGHLLECGNLNVRFINKCETYHMLRRNIVATSLKILWKNLHSIKCYDY